MTTPHIRFSIFTFLALVSLVACTPKGEKPSRSECIVLVSQPESRWVQRTSEDAYSIAQTIHDLGYPMGGIAYGKRGKIYFQFSARCEQREEMARKLMSTVYGSLADSYTYKVDGIAPGVNTIEVSGTSWRDD